ncbi:rhomboid family intramembrane serine protease [Agitococcus lubricus]|uniref:Membrane associated rhomboid family serine protease n=1 Tax=Agitococcus lubricus TaxID=1077255 RepID=A0A2T5IW65_9GAMM|nr:rhomboid family intramembrane serine protease [Agitococcus lubricus]PTQ88159.1 membrane associated rhomboid family serine protease [Agitococcus lubricus]
MLIAPIDKPYDYHKPPRLCLAICALLLLLFAWLQPLDTARQQHLQRYYQQHLLAVEWPLYPTHLLQQQQTQTLDTLQKAYDRGQYDLLSQQIGFDYAFAASITKQGDDYLDTEVFSQWQENRRIFNEQRDLMSTQILGLDAQRFRPITFVTYAFLDHNSADILLAVVLLLLVGILLEHSLGSGIVLTAWAVGSLSAGIVYLVTHLHAISPLVGAFGAISALLGVAFIRFNQTASLRLLNSQLKTNGWLFLALFIAYALYHSWSHHDLWLLAACSVAFVSGIILHFLYQRWFIKLPTPDTEEVIVDEVPKDEVYRHELHHILTKISEMQFANAEKQLRTLLEKYPDDRRVLEHLYHLIKFKPAELEFEATTMGIFNLANQKTDNHLILSIYNDYKRRSLSFASLDSDTCFKLAMRFARISAYKEAEEVYKRGAESKRPSVLAKKAALVLSQLFEQLHHQQRASYYQQLANQKTDPIP